MPELMDDLASKWWNDKELQNRDDVKEMVAFQVETARLNAEHELSSRVIDRMESAGAVVGLFVGLGLWVLMMQSLIAYSMEVPFVIGMVLAFGGFVGLPLAVGAPLTWFGGWCGRRLVRPVQHQ